MRIHFIAIGGAIMHHLAMALQKQGHSVSGSDDKIADPAKTNLANAGILPDSIGFFEEKITSDIDAIILGMHARIDNIELLKAQRLGIKIYSFPHFIYEFAKEKKRVVIAGSHGKTSITSMVMHVLKKRGFDFDYMVGAAVQGFDSAVKLSTDAPIIILEGDEYLASPLHLESKFMFYAPQIALISGIAWDHINVFPVYEGYVNQFAKLMDIVEETIVYFKHDNELPKLVEKYKGKATLKGYENPSYAVLEEKTYIQDSEHKYAMSVFGEHNLQNIEGARLVCESLGVKKEDFYIAIADFSGAANRLQKLGENDKTVIYKDFAHSPSKLKATVDATRLQFKNRTIIAVMELHTFSSLNKDFWQEYAGSMDASDTAIVYIDEETLALKKMPPIDKNEVIASFKKDGLQVLQNKTELANFLLSQNYENAVLLLMTSGTFGGLDITNTTNEILAK
jgi:UDP-N-acetylmuramate: L-alanyl-gamma-D-glutamyl-meso-diaminopimelate ligase